MTTWWRKTVRTLLFLTIITVAFAPLIEGGTTHLPVFILHMLVLIMLSVWFAAGYKTGRLSLRGCALDLAGAAFLAAALVSLAVAPYKYMALLWVQLIVYYLLFLYLSREALYAEGAAGLAGMAVLGMGAVESLWGIGQRLYGKDRLTGSFFNPDMLAGYLAPSILLAVSLVVFGHASASGRMKKILLSAFAALGFIVVILTGSRGGALALCAGALVVLWARFGRVAIAFAAVLALCILLIPNPVRDRVLSHETFAYSRTGIWKSSLAMMLDHPQGVGLGNFQYAFTRYNFPVREAVIKYGKTAGTAHNEYLHIGAEMGLLGLFALLFGVFLLIRARARAIRVSAGNGDIGLAAGLAGGITAVMVHALVDSNLHEPGIVFLLILLVSLVLRLSGGGKSWTLALEGGKKPRTLLLFAALTALMAVFAAMPAAAYYLSRKANAEAHSGDMTSAMEDIDTALLIEPGNASYHNQKAATLFAQARGGGEGPQGPLDELEEAARLNPGDITYPLLISGLEYGYANALPASAERRKYLESALGHAERAGELGPGTAEAELSRARIYIAMGNREQAVRVLEGLKAAEPNCLRGRLMLALEYRELGKTELSKREYYNIIETAAALKTRSLTPEEKLFVKLDPAALDALNRLGKDLGISN